MNDQNHHQRYAAPAEKRRRSRDGNDASPWQAMKRLRVAEQANHQIASAREQSPWSAEQQSDFAHGAPHHQDAYERQVAGQDTMSEGWGSPSSAMPRQTPSATKSEDTDYQSVNTILGALHLERRQREHTVDPYHQTTASASSQEQQHSNFQTPTSTRAYDHSYQTPPPKPGKRKVVHLPTNSKLG
jgi:hypothetical protein